MQHLQCHPAGSARCRQALVLVKRLVQCVLEQVMKCRQPLQPPQAQSVEPCRAQAISVALRICCAGTTTLEALQLPEVQKGQEHAVPCILKCCIPGLVQMLMVQMPMRTMRREKLQERTLSRVTSLLAALAATSSNCRPLCPFPRRSCKLRVGRGDAAGVDRETP